MAKQSDTLTQAVTRTKQVIFLGGTVVLVVGGLAAAWDRLAGVRLVVSVFAALFVGLAAWAVWSLARAFRRTVDALEVKHEGVVRDLGVQHDALAAAFGSVAATLSDPKWAFAAAVFRTSAPQQGVPNPSHVMQRKSGTARFCVQLVVVNPSPYRMVVSDLGFHWSALIVSDDHVDSREIAVVEPYDRREVTVEVKTRTSKFRYDVTDDRRRIAHVYLSQASAKVRLLDAATDAPLGEAVTLPIADGTMSLPVECE